MRFLPPILLVPAIAAVVWGLVAWLIKQGRAEYQRTAETLGALSTLPPAEAERRALTLLADETLFRCIESAPPEPARLEPFADGLRRLLSRYERVETARGPSTRIDRDLIAPSDSHPGFMVLGKGMENTDVEFDLGARADEEAVYELHGNEAPDPTFGTYRSVYHWVLAFATEAK